MPPLPNIRSIRLLWIVSIALLAWIVNSSAIVTPAPRGRLLPRRDNDAPKLVLVRTCDRDGSKFTCYTGSCCIADKWYSCCDDPNDYTPLTTCLDYGAKTTCEDDGCTSCPGREVCTTWSAGTRTSWDCGIFGSIKTPPPTRSSSTSKTQSPSVSASTTNASSSSTTTTSAQTSSDVQSKTSSAQTTTALQTTITVTPQSTDSLPAPTTNLTPTPGTPSMPTQTSSPPMSGTPSSTSDPIPGLSSKAKGGIVIGSILGAMALIIIPYLVIRYRRRLRNLIQRPGNNNNPDNTTSGPPHNPVPELPPDIAGPAYTPSRPMTPTPETRNTYTLFPSLKFSHRQPNDTAPTTPPRNKHDYTFPWNTAHAASQDRHELSPLPYPTSPSSPSSTTPLPLNTYNPTSSPINHESTSPISPILPVRREGSPAKPAKQFSSLPRHLQLERDYARQQLTGNTEAGYEGGLDDYEYRSSAMLPRVAGPMALSPERALGGGYWEAEREQVEADRVVGKGKGVGL